jgi:hypothetical protein
MVRRARIVPHSGHEYNIMVPYVKGNFVTDLLNPVVRWRSDRRLRAFWGEVSGNQGQRPQGAPSVCRDAWGRRVNAFGAKGHRAV